MHAAVIELDALPDPVRATAEYDDFLAIGRCRFALILVGGIQVSGIGGEFRGAGIDAFIGWTHFQRMAKRTHGGFVCADQLGDAGIGKALALEVTHTDGIQSRQTAVGDFRLDGDQFLDLVEEPGIYEAELENLIDTQAGTEGLGDLEQPFRPRFFQFAFDA